MAIPLTSSLTRDDWLNIARCAYHRGVIAEREGDVEREDREFTLWADIVCMVNC